jgi:hypothetical protein
MSRPITEREGLFIVALVCVTTAANFALYFHLI